MRWWNSNSGRPQPDYEIVGDRQGIVYLVDLDRGGPSVTNSAELVVAKVAPNYPGHRIVYRDTTGRWDELVHTDGTFTGIRAWLGNVPELFD
jgi:hypothetical protein